MYHHHFHPDFFIFGFLYQLCTFSFFDTKENIQSHIPHKHYKCPFLNKCIIIFTLISLLLISLPRMHTRRVLSSLNDHWVVLDGILASFPFHSISMVSIVDLSRIHPSTPCYLRDVLPSLPPVSAALLSTKALKGMTSPPRSLTLMYLPPFC